MQVKVPQNMEGKNYECEKRTAAENFRTDY